MVKDERKVGGWVGGYWGLVVDFGWVFRGLDLVAGGPGGGGGFSGVKS